MKISLKYYPSPSPPKFGFDAFEIPHLKAIHFGRLSLFIRF